MEQSSKTTREIMIVIALVIVLGAAIWYSKTRGGKNAVFKAGSGALVKFDFNEAKKRLDSPMGTVDAAYDEGAIRNPMEKPAELYSLMAQGTSPYAPAGPDQQKIGEFVLEGVIWGSGNSKNLAIISGSVVSEGEIVSGARVIRIDKNGVVLLKDGSEINLAR